MTKSKNRLLYGRMGDDPVLQAVMADIHKKVGIPPKGYMTREQWANKWKINTHDSAKYYIDRALRLGVLQMKRVRIVTKGRIRLMNLYGPPDKRKAP